MLNKIKLLYVKIIIETNRPVVHLIFLLVLLFLTIILMFDKTMSLGFWIFPFIAASLCMLNGHGVDKENIALGNKKDFLIQEIEILNEKNLLENTIKNEYSLKEIHKNHKI